MDEARQVRAHDVGPNSAGRLDCPYEDCASDFATGRDRLRHMLSARHRAATLWRLSEIEQHLGGVDWRSRASCRGKGDAWIREPGSVGKKTARATGARPPTKSERRAIAICATCPVRRDCAKASLTPVPASTELPVSRPVLYEPYGIFCGVPADARKKLVEVYGTGPDALEALLRLGEIFATEYPANHGEQV